MMISLTFNNLHLRAKGCERGRRPRPIVSFFVSARTICSNSKKKVGSFVALKRPSFHFHKKHVPGNMVTCYMFRNAIRLEPQATECLYYYSAAAGANAEFKMAKNHGLSTRSGIQKDLWLIVWTGAWQEDISWLPKLEHTSYTLGNIFSYLLLMAAFILGQVPNRGGCERGPNCEHIL